MIESLRVRTWLIALLKADATLLPLIAGRVYGSRIPAGAIFPLIQMNMQSGRDIQGLGTNRLMSRPLFQIKVITRGGITAETEAITDRLDQILQNTSAVPHRGVVISAQREQEISYTEQIDSDTFFEHTGGLYRFSLQKAVAV